MFAKLSKIIMQKKFLSFREALGGSKKKNLPIDLTFFWEVWE